KYARIEKKKLADKALSYLCRNNYSCPDVFDALYSKNHSESMKKASEYKRKFKDELVIRHQYIWAFDEIFNQQQDLDEMFDSLEQFSEHPDYPNRSTDILKIMNAVTILHETEKYKDRIHTGRLTFVNLAILL